MPVIYTSLQENQKTILKSCFFSVIKDVTQAIGVPKDAVVTMHRGVEISRTDNRNNVSIREVQNNPATVSQRRVVAVVQDNYDEDSLTSTVVSQHDSYPIFHDPEIAVSVYPVYVKTMVKMDVSYSCGSKTEAFRVRDDIRVKLSQCRNILHHQVEYNILLPEPVEEFVGDVYDLKSRLYPQSLEEYFMSNATKRIHFITDMANKENSKIAVHERQVRIVGTFDFTEVPEIEQNNETNTYKLTFPYTFTIDVPSGMCMKYPAMICNRLMKYEYLSFVQDRKLAMRAEKERERSGTNSIMSLSHFESHRQVSMRIDDALPLNVPLFDEFYEKVSHTGYVIIASFLTDVDETDFKSLLNLRELGEFVMDEALLTHIANGERRWIVQPQTSPFYLALSQDGRHFNNNILEIDEHLNVRSKVKLSLLRPVRVTLSVCIDPTVLLDKAIDRLNENKDICLLYVTEVIRGIVNYKPEFAKMNVPESTLYRFFILLLYDALKKGDCVFINAFLVIFSMDKRMLEILVGTIGSNYLSVFNNVCGIDFKGGKNFVNTGDDSYAMKTVMSARVDALRIEN